MPAAAPAPALASLRSLLDMVASYEDITVPVTDCYSKLVVTDDTTCASITDSYFCGERRIIIRGEDLTVIARRGITIFPTIPDSYATKCSAYLQSHPYTHVSRDIPFTAAQRRYLVASGYVVTAPTKASLRV
jgi:hypothetical protein